MPHKQVSNGRCLARLSFLAFCLFPVGCQTWVPEPSGFISHNTELRQKSKTALWHYDAEPCACEGPRIVVIRSVQWLADSEKANKWVPEFCDLLKRRLRKWLIQGLPQHAFMVGSEAEAEEYQGAEKLNVMLLDVAITSTEEGNGALRYLIGFGLGGVKLVAECRARHSTCSPEELHAAVVRTKSHGNPWYGLNFRVWSARYCLRFAADQAAQQLAQHLLSLEELKPRANMNTGEAGVERMRRPRESSDRTPIEIARAERRLNSLATALTKHDAQGVGSKYSSA